MQFTKPKGERGRRAVHEGYQYTQHRAGDGDKWSQWHCIRRTCHGRIKISSTETEHVQVSEHDHLPNFGDAKASLAVAGMKRRAEREINVAPLHLTQAVLSNCDSETLIQMPKERTMKKAIQRVRREAQPSLPKTLADLEEVPEMYSRIDGDIWLQHDSGPDDEDRFILFGSRLAMREMGNSPMWFADGTFKSAPSIAAQLYVVHYERHGNVLLGCVALMTRRSARSYQNLFEAIRDRLPPSRRDGPAKVSTDFEVAAMNAFTTVFPNATEAYCFFHFSQSMWRKAQETGVAAAYMREGNVELRAQFHAIIALPFVPLQHLEATFRDLKEAADDQLSDVLKLVEEYYILGRGRGQRRAAPRFPPRTWNVVERTLEGQGRTNNTAEGWNRRWNTLIGKTHPNVYEFLEAMKKEEKYSAAQRELVNLGNSPPKKKRKYLQNDQRLERLVSRFDEIVAEEGDDDDDGDEDDAWSTGRLTYLRSVGQSARGQFDN
jgi:hypothetical protein